MPTKIMSANGTSLPKAVQVIRRTEIIKGVGLTSPVMHFNCNNARGYDAKDTEQKLSLNDCNAYSNDSAQYIQTE